MGKIVLSLFILLTLAHISIAQIDTLFPVESRYIYKDIDDVEIITSDDRTTSLSKIWQDKPIILTLIFSRCAGICFPLVSSLKYCVEKIDNDRKFDFYTVVLSFDTADTPEDMAVLKEGYGLSSNKNWIFGVFANSTQIEKFSEEIGFWYKWIDSTGQFDHPGMVVGIRQGKVVRILVGGNINLVKLREVVQEIKGEFVPFYGVQKNVAFRCINYDPETGKIKIGIGTMIIFTPPVLTFVLTFVIFGFTRRGSGASIAHKSKTKKEA